MRILACFFRSEMETDWNYFRVNADFKHNMSPEKKQNPTGFQTSLEALLFTFSFVTLLSHRTPQLPVDS